MVLYNNLVCGYFGKNYKTKINICRCSHCGMVLSNEYALNTHLNYNKDCKIIRLENEVKLLKERLKRIINNDSICLLQNVLKILVKGEIK